MSDQYLWERTGQPDPEMERLERVLGNLRFADPPRKHTGRGRWQPLALAASLVAGIALWQISIARPSPITPWKLGNATLHTGEFIRSRNTPTILWAEDVGRVELDPGAEVRIAESRSDLQRLDLKSGRLRATIWAPPKRFVVDTPSTRAIDLGCQYTLSTDSNGDGTIDVETGWVAFQLGRVESFIPAGARCRTRRQSGPGTPYFTDAPPSLVAALDEFDRSGGGGALDRVLASARPRDAISLWHLLPRVPDAARASVYERLSQLVALPASIDRDAIIALNPRTLDEAWDALGLDSAGWWRVWKRPWLVPTPGADRQ